MRLKYYLRGVGIGILFATIILAISFHNRIKNEALSDSEIVELAKGMGMEFVGTEAGDELLDNTEADTENDTQTNTQIDTQADTQSSDQPVVPPDTQVDTPEPQPTEFALEVTNDLSWRLACMELEAGGVVADGNDLYMYFEHNYGNSYILFNGTHMVPYGADYDTIITILSTR